MIIKLPAVYDISHWKEVADFNAISPRPVMMITKATEGTGFIDSKFVRFFAGMKQAGYLRGCYHFFRKAYSAATQAQFFVDIIKPHIDDNTILILDMEEGGESAAQVLAWFDHVRARLPRNHVLLYSRRNLLEALIMTATQKEAFRKIPVWVAGYPINPDQYTSVPNFYIPDQARFGAVVLWQYSDKGQVWGIQGDADLNWISDTYFQIIGGEPPPPPVEEPVDYYEIKGNSATDYRSIRQGPDIRTALLYKLLPGQIAKAGVTVDDVYVYQNDIPNGSGGYWARAGDMWRRVYEHNGARVTGWIAKVHLGRTYITERLVTVTEPPPVGGTAFTLTVAGYKPFSGELERE